MSEICILKSLDINELQNIINNSSSLSSTLRNVGLSVRVYYIKILREIIDKNNLNVSSFCKTSRINITLSNEELFKANSHVSSSTVRRRFFLLNPKYECVECGIQGEYNNKKLVLQLDHINGVSTDNRLDNLRLLCPNCHSQTNTYTGKNTNRVKKITRCIDCGVIILAGSKKCVKCSNSSKIKKFEVSKEELEVLIKEKPMTEIGKMFNVSDNSIRNRCKKLGVSLENRKYKRNKLK